MIAKETTMKFRSNLIGALAAAMTLVPGVSAAGDIEGAWGKFHNAHVSAAGSAPATGGIVGAWASFHLRHAGEHGAGSPSEARSSLQNPWERFHQGHLGSAFRG
jgi:hypothetical protein